MQSHQPIPEDIVDQTAVLGHVLLLHPLALRLDDLVSEMAREGESGEEVENAVRELVRGGLLHRQCELVLPTRAAMLFYELDL
jgi:hypothetical protein